MRGLALLCRTLLQIHPSSVGGGTQFHSICPIPCILTIQDFKVLRPNMVLVRVQKVFDKCSGHHLKFWDLGGAQIRVLTGQMEQKVV